MLDETPFRSDSSAFISNLLQQLYLSWDKIVVKSLVKAYDFCFIFCVPRIPDCVIFSLCFPFFCLRCLLFNYYLFSFYLNLIICSFLSFSSFFLFFFFLSFILSFFSFFLSFFLSFFFSLSIFIFSLILCVSSVLMY